MIGTGSLIFDTATVWPVADSSLRSRDRYRVSETVL